VPYLGAQRVAVVVPRVDQEAGQAADRLAPADADTEEQQGPGTRNTDTEASTQSGDTKRNRASGLALRPSNLSHVAWNPG
jgi:hypothetical protein